MRVALDPDRRNHRRSLFARRQDDGQRRCLRHRWQRCRCSSRRFDPWPRPGRRSSVSISESEMGDRTLRPLVDSRAAESPHGKKPPGAPTPERADLRRRGPSRHSERAPQCERGDVSTRTTRPGSCEYVPSSWSSSISRTRRRRRSAASRWRDRGPTRARMGSGWTCNIGLDAQYEIDTRR